MRRLLLAAVGIAATSGTALAGGPTPPHVAPVDISVNTNTVVSGGGSAGTDVNVGNLHIAISVTGRSTVGLATSQSLSINGSGFTVP
jgi:hypothetical protein